MDQFLNDAVINYDPRLGINRPDSAGVVGTVSLEEMREHVTMVSHEERLRPVAPNITRQG